MHLRFYAGLASLCIFASAGAQTTDYWERDPAFAPVLESSLPASTVTHILAGGGNKVLVVRPPYAINGVRPPTPARLNVDGSLDATFAPPENETLVALVAYEDGRVLVRRTIGSDPLGEFAVVRLTAAGAIDPTFSPAVLSLSATVSARVLADGRVLLTGSFLTVNGQPKPRICLLNADGSVSAAFSSPFNATPAVSITAVPLPSGKIVIFGSFQDLGPDKVDAFARLNSDGSVDRTFNSSSLPLPEQITAVFPAGDHLLVAWGASSIFRLNADGTRDDSYTHQLGGTVQAFGPLQSDGKLLYVVETDDLQFALRRLNVDGSPDTGFSIVTPRNTGYTAIAPVLAADGTLHVGSALTAERHAARFQVTRVLADGSIDPNYRPRFSEAGAVDASVRQPDGKRFIAGRFDHVNGEAVSTEFSFLRFTADGAVDDTFGPALAAGDRVTDIYLQPGGKITASGYSTASGASFIRRFNSDGSSDDSFHLPATTTADLIFDAARNIYRVEAVGDTLGLKRYTPDGDSDTGFSAVPLGAPYRFAIWPNGEVAVTISQMAEWGLPVTTVQRYQPDGTLDASFALNRNLLPPTITGLVALPDGRLLVAGTVRDSDIEATAYVRFDRTGALDFQFYGATLSSVPGASHLFGAPQALEAAGVIYDAWVAANAAPGTQLQAELRLNTAVLTLDLSREGALIVGGNGLGAGSYTRISSEGPTFDPRPTVLSARRSGVGPVSIGSRVLIFAVGGGRFPLSYQWFHAGTPITGATSSTLIINPVAAASAGDYTVAISNAHGTAISSPVPLAVDTSPAVPAVVQQADSRVVLSTGDAEISVYVSGNPLPTVEWRRDGIALTDPAVSTAPGTVSYRVSLLTLSAETSRTGIYTALATNASGSIVSAPTVFGRLISTKVIGAATEIGPNILHPSGRTFDQILLEGAAASITADSGQVTRMSFVDMNDDIVQVEFSGAGTVSLTLAGAPGPAAPASHYVQPGLNYMKGHASIVVAGANETSHLSVFTVGRANAIDQSLFRDDVTYDGVADLGYIAILSANGKFGGLRCANVGFFAANGLTGVYAPGVEFTGPVYVGDVDAFDQAEPVLVLGSAQGDTWITGGNLAQTNAKPVRVSGLTQLKFVAGTTSHGTALPAQANQARLERDGVDVTAQIVAAP